MTVPTRRPMESPDAPGSMKSSDEPVEVTVAMIRSPASMSAPDTSTRTPDQSHGAIMSSDRDRDFPGIGILVIGGRHRGSSTTALPR